MYVCATLLLINADDDDDLVNFFRASVVRDFSAFETGLAFPIQCVNQAPETTTNPPATQSPEFTPPPEIEGCSFSSFNSIPAGNIVAELKE